MPARKVKYHLPDYRELALVSDGVRGSSRWTKPVELNFGCYSLCRSWRNFAAASIGPLSVWDVTLRWLACDSVCPVR